MNVDSMGDWRRSHYTTEVRPEMHGQEVTLFGWVQEMRDLGGLRFIILEDREGTVQITIVKKKADAEVISKSENLQKRFSLAVRGYVKKTDLTPRGIEVIPKQIKVLSSAVAQLPIDISGKTPANLEARLDARALDLTQPINISTFKIQHTALDSIREYLFSRGFVETHTPRIIASATEGGAELFSIDYFDRKAYLAQSPQLYKEQLILSLEKVFEVGPFFRAEESHTRRHLSEFVSIDVEEAFADAEDVMRLLEELMQFTCIRLNERCTKELTLLKHTLKVPDLPFKRVSYDEVLADLKREGTELQWGEDIPTPALRTLGKLHAGFYFITRWPKSTRSFYIQPADDNSEVTEGFDLMWRWIELVSGGTRIASKELLMERLREKGLNPDSFKYHLQSFDYGMPPHAGWAIGLERLTMMLTGIRNIREATLFPRDKYRLTP